jgi:hypothetical protein
LTSAACGRRSAGRRLAARLLSRGAVIGEFDAAVPGIGTGADRRMAASAWSRGASRLTRWPAGSVAGSRPPACPVCAHYEGVPLRIRRAGAWRWQEPAVQAGNPHDLDQRRPGRGQPERAASLLRVIGHAQQRAQAPGIAELSAARSTITGPRWRPVTCLTYLTACSAVATSSSPPTPRLRWILRSWQGRRSRAAA